MLRFIPAPAGNSPEASRCVNPGQSSARSRFRSKCGQSSGEPRRQSYMLCLPCAPGSSSRSARYCGRRCRTRITRAQDRPQDVVPPVSAFMNVGQVKAASLPDPAAAGKPAAPGQVELARGVNPLQHPLSRHRSELAGQRARGGLRTTPATWMPAQQSPFAQTPPKSLSYAG